MSDVSILGKTARVISSVTLSAGELTKNVRVDGRGDVFTIGGMSPLQGAALSGTYFVGCNATPGTEIAVSADQTAYDQNVPVMLFYNSSTTKSCILDYISLKLETVPASATRYLYTLAAYDGDAYSSGGTQLTSKCTLIGSSETSSVECYFGAIASVDVAKTILTTGSLIDVVPVIDSTFLFRFGAMSSSSATHGAATAQHIVRDLPPIVLGPETSLELYLYGDSQSATPTYEPTAGWIER
jgi:hypothetical protein